MSDYKATNWRRLSDEQWGKISAHLPEHKASPEGGRPRVSDRKCFEGILWILRTGAPWADLPRKYPSDTTCWRRLKEWSETGVFKKMWKTFLADLNADGQVHWAEAYIDATFTAAKSGGDKVGKTKKGKGSKIMLVVDAKGTPLAMHLDSASPSEVSLIDATMSDLSVGRSGVPGRPRTKPDRLVGDKAYDSNPARKSLAERGIQPIFPARKNNKVATHQDGRSLRRYKRRWHVERMFAWLHSFRRLFVRHEKKSFIFTGLVQLACALITLKLVLK